MIVLCNDLLIFFYFSRSCSFLDMSQRSNLSWLVENENDFFGIFRALIIYQFYPFWVVLVPYSLLFLVAVMLLVYVLLFKNLLRKTLSWRAKRCIFVSELFLVNFCTWKSSALSKYLSTSNWLWCHSWPNNLVDDGTGGIQLLILCCCSLARFFKHNMTGAAPKCGFSGQISPISK